MSKSGWIILTEQSLRVSMIKTLYFSLLAFFLLFFMCVCEVQADDNFHATCIRIIDGDTIDVVPENTNKLIRVRLWGIDAPESHQPFGIHATQYLAEKILGESVEISIVSSDMYGRLIGNVYCDDVYINKEMISVGCAWHYEKYAPRATDLANAQRHAKSNKLGLWSTPTPTPPWLYRRNKKDYYVKMAVSPLIAAAAAGHGEIVRFLIQSGVDATGLAGKLALFAAIQSGHTEVVKILLESGIEVGSENETYEENCVSLCLNKNKLSGKCVRINDGDTIDICSIDGRFTKVHLYGIDAPELSQLRGIDSQEFLFNKIQGKNVEIELIGKTTKGEHVAHVFCEGKHVNLQVISAGWARSINEIGNNSTLFFDAENKAITNKLGIWGDFSHPVVSPSQFRKTQARINYTGSSAIYIAAATGNLEIAKILLEYGVKVNNKIGTNAIKYAKESGNRDLVNFFVENGAIEKANLIPDFQILEIDTAEILPQTSTIREGDFSLLRKQSSKLTETNRYYNGYVTPYTSNLYSYNITEADSKSVRLIEAAAKGDMAMVKKLVNDGTNPNIIYSSFRLYNTKKDIATPEPPNNQANASNNSETYKGTNDNTFTDNSARVEQNTYSKQSKPFTSNSLTRPSSRSYNSRSNEWNIDGKYVVTGLVFLFILFIWFTCKDWYHVSTKKDSLFLTKLFYKLGFSIKSKEGRPSALYYAVLYGREAIVKYLISIGSELECGYRNNLIIVACMNSHYNIASILLKHGVNVYAALSIAVEMGNKNIVRFLFTSKPEIKTDHEQVKCLLETAIRKNQTISLITLIDLGCVPDNSDLSFAIRCHCEQSIYQVLLNYGLKFNINHLINSIVSNNMNLFMQILSTGIDVNSLNKHDVSCLEQAIVCKRTDMAILLIENGADVFARRPNSTTLMNKAEKKYMYKVVEKIREKGGCMYASAQDAKVKAMKNSK